jgi:hypothetical protein
VHCNKNEHVFAIIRLKTTCFEKYILYLYGRMNDASGPGPADRGGDAFAATGQEGDMPGWSERNGEFGESP